MKMRREKRTGKLQLLQSIVLEESTMAKSQIEEVSRSSILYEINDFLLNSGTVDMFLISVHRVL
jgi:hypothetical protein